MIDGKDIFCLSIKGRPVTKKRPRIMGFAKYTGDMWYDNLVKESFKRLYPNVDPIGIEFFKTFKRKTKNKIITIYKRLKNVKDEELPKVRIIMIFYFNGGKLGDEDNYMKMILDALNKTLYVDDNQVKVPTSYVVLDKYEEERVDILAFSYILAF